MKYLIFDAGPIISLTMNSMLRAIEKLKENFEGAFVITPQVKKEIIDRPLKIKKYKLEALQVQDLIDRGVLTLSNKLVSNSKLEKEMKRILKASNGVLRTTNSGEKITLLHNGEASCMAFVNLLKGEHLIVVDERTTRLLVEAPKNLERLMEKKLHRPMDLVESLTQEFSKYKIIRSAELLFVAYKKGLIPMKKDKQLLDALLYGVKFKGTAISSREIEEMKRMG